MIIYVGGGPQADDFLPIVDDWLCIVRFCKPEKKILDKADYERDIQLDREVL